MKAKFLVYALPALILTTIHLVAAQQPVKVYRIGYLTATSPSVNEGFRQGLRNLNYIEGKNIVIEPRFAEGKLDRLPELAAELVRLKVDVVVVASSQAVRAAKETTTTIPIVMAISGDVVGTGSPPVDTISCEIMRCTTKWREAPIRTMSLRRELLIQVRLVPCETFPGQYANSATNQANYMASWVNEPGRF